MPMKILKQKERLREMKMIKITLKRSLIGQSFKAKETIKSLGLKKINSSVERKMDESLSGMLNKVSHLVEIEDLK